MIRSFISINIPDELKKEAKALQEMFKNAMQMSDGQG